MDREYFDKLLVHEVSPIYLALLAENNGSRFRGPNWSIQGTEEYFGTYYSTDYWRDKGINVYKSRLAQTPSTLDADYGLNVSNVYNDGFLVMSFLHDEFGKDTVFKIIRSSEPTFGKRIAGATEIKFNVFLDRLKVWKKRVISGVNSNTP